MNGTVGLGIVGCGDISVHHIRNSLDDPRVEWVAACDVRPDAVRERADEFDIPGRYADPDDLLADAAVDAVVIATPPTAHAAPTIAALRAGKHVLVEKPVAINWVEVEAMVAAQRPGVVGACCSSRFRSTPSAHAAAELLASGELGAVRRLSANALGPPPANYDGTSPFMLYRPNWGNQGALADWGCYDLDFLLGLCGWSLEPTLVLAETRNLPGVYRAIAEPRNDVEVQVGALALMTDGAVLDYRRAMFAAVDKARGEWWIECEDGALELNMLPGTPQATVHRYTAGGVSSEVLVEEPYQWPMIHRGPVIDFVDAIIEGHEPMTSLVNSLTVQRLTDAIYASAESGKARAL